MTERYIYVFADNLTMTYLTPLPFTFLKFAIDKHGALVKCYKKVVEKNED